MKLFRLPVMTEESKSRIIRLLGSLAFIAAITIAGLFVFERINAMFFNSLTVGDTHILTILLGSALTTFAALLVLLQFDRLNAELSRENDERRHAEKALVKSKAILSRAQVIAHIGNWAWDLKTQNMSWSDEIFKIFGYRPQEFQPSFEWLMSKIVPEDRQLIETSLSLALQDNKLFNIDYRIIASDGTVRYINMVADRVRRDRAGNPEWMYGITQDITRRKRIETELQESKAQAELYVDLMGHDINNMNQIAMGYLELAYDQVATEGKLDASGINLLEKPIEAMKNIARLISNVKKLQREKLGEYKMKPIDLSHVLSEIKAQYSSVPGRDVSISFKSAGKCLVLANDLITDLYANIVGNAVKHSKGPLQIDISLDRVSADGNQYCQVTIDDNGPGISDDMKVQLVRRQCMPNMRYSGKGLGLCLVKTLVDDFRGSLRIEDRVPGDHRKGARFVIVLPALE